MLHQQRLVGDCQTAMGSMRPPCSINYASGACLITWSTRLANKPWPDLLIIKMQSNLLPVCCVDWTWRGAVSQPRCLWVTYIFQRSHTTLVVFKLLPIWRGLALIFLTMWTRFNSKLVKYGGLVTFYLPLSPFPCWGLSGRVSKNT